MKALLLTVVVLCGAIGSVVAQKKSTVAGDLVIGELTGRDEATREITVKYPGKEGTEIFSGILVDDYKLKMADDNRRDLMLSELVPGLHVRVFYKTHREKVNGQEKKINKISRLELLGEDQYFRIRKQLNLNPTTVISHAEKDDLPATSPLKIYPAIAYSNVPQHLLASIDKWNQKNGDVYGKLEVVSDLKQADILIVVARGADTMVAVLPAEFYDGSSVVKGEWSQATSYLVVRDPGGLKVLWTSVVPIFSTSNVEASPKSFEVVMAELEKRIKARARNSRSK
jgi:hypothetical protein